jgi:hypothetical protein
MIRSVLLMVVMVLPLFAADVGAEDWPIVTQDRDRKISLHADRGSIEIVSENILRAWVRYQYQQHFQGRREYDCMKCTPEKFLSHTIAHKEFDCAERKTRFLRITEYYTDQTVRTEEIEGPWRKVRPEDAEASLIRYVCAQRQ